MPETKDIKTLLADAVRKRDELNIFIKMLQEAGAEVATESTSTDGSQQSFKPGQEITDPLTVVYPGMFFGKKQPQAVKELLEKVKPRPVKTKTLVECLKKGGLKMGGKKPEINLWGVLNRNKDIFILVPKAGWALTGWFDAGVIAKYRKEGPKENGEEEKTKE